MQINVFELMAFPPIAFFLLTSNGQKWALEIHENYNKRSYRNRYDILGANGVMPQIIPLKKGKNNHLPIREVRISYDTEWVAKHLHTIKSAYGRAPYFEEYFPAIAPLFKRRPPTLFEFNRTALQTVFQILDKDTTLPFTDHFIPADSPGYRSFKDFIRPATISEFQNPPYFQVFDDRGPIVSGLSSLDLIFNLGPEAEIYLKNTVNFVYNG